VESEQSERTLTEPQCLCPSGPKGEGFFREAENAEVVSREAGTTRCLDWVADDWPEARSCGVAEKKAGLVSPAG
jgi:hypothetical protein